MENTYFMAHPQFTFHDEDRLIFMSKLLVHSRQHKCKLMKQCIVIFCIIKINMAKKGFYFVET